MKNGPRLTMRSRQPRPATADIGYCCYPRAQGVSKRTEKLERYLALACTEAQARNPVGAENCYQHAEHYFRSMSSTREKQ